jgi:tRNA 2-thiouridine synthesizing protein A
MHGAKGQLMSSKKILEDDQWNAGDLGCGELVMVLRTRLRAMPGKVLKVTALDPGAPSDIPAYCQMTGHQLLKSSQECCAYWIRAKKE